MREKKIMQYFGIKTICYHGHQSDQSLQEYNAIVF